MDPTLIPAGAEPTRRDFALAAVALAATTLAPAGAYADEPKPAEKPTLPQVYEQLVRLRFGAYLDEEQIKKLTQRVQGQRTTAEALKKIPLTNSDEPAFVFSAS